MNVQTFNQLLTPQQASEVLQVSPETLNVWRATRRYKLPYVKVGRSVRYRLSDLEAFIQERLVGS
jgi:excisionase family DNA binding protein